MTNARKAEVKARMRATGESYMQAARRLAEGAQTVPQYTVGTVGFLLSSHLPERMWASPSPQASPEEVFAQILANSLSSLTRESTGEVYPAMATLAVKRPERQPNDGPAGWTPVEALVLIRARRRWQDHEEDHRVIVDALRVAQDAAHRAWPGLPEHWQPAAMNIHDVAFLRKWGDTDEAVVQYGREAVAKVSTVHVMVAEDLK